ncbi:protein disulfide-isomerase A3-like [Stylophora pistillata]|uniref:Protein disulfide-isomerase 2 n=1 Tax=Stylophora pistillata TaxID=50429 RepID=A0A2B4RI00_STYPI|nr:protein disulfide-isomerase A3-like [Stylophora pistillata]PFX16419.1 Protein disulfide-isomerase 2 [Stylophora pistillata]
MKFSIALIAVFVTLAVSLVTQKEPLVEELTENTFDNYLTVSNLAIVDFFAPWCPHCKSFTPEYEQAASKAQAEKLNAFFAKVDCAGSGQSLCKKLHIRFLPTVRLFRDGKPLGDYSGERTADAVLQFMQKAIKAPNDMKLTMSDDVSETPSNVTPWHAEDKKSH